MSNTIMMVFKAFFNKLTEVIVNGTKYFCKSKIEINGNNNVYIDGKNVCTIRQGSRIDISINGNCTNVFSSSGDVKVEGNVLQSIETMSGDVDVVGDVAGNIDTKSGDISCKNVSENIKTLSGDINVRK